MSAPELAACPFCGRNAKRFGSNMVGCEDQTNCGAYVDWGHYTRGDGPVEAWNRRADLHDATALDPDMPADELRLHMGELTDQEVLTARAAIRWANSAHAAQVDTLREALQGLRDCIHETRGKNAHDAVEAADAALLLATLKAVEAQR